MSDKTAVVFTIKESIGGTPYLNMEFHDAVPGLPVDPPIFYLAEGADMEKAEEVARYLNHNIAAFQFAPGRK